jgi:hypothetical protein
MTQPGVLVTRLSLPSLMSCCCAWGNTASPPSRIRQTGDETGDAASGQSGTCVKSPRPMGRHLRRRRIAKECCTTKNLVVAVRALSLIVREPLEVYIQRLKVV